MPSVYGGLKKRCALNRFLFGGFESMKYFYTNKTTKNIIS